MGEGVAGLGVGAEAVVGHSTGGFGEREDLFTPKGRISLKAHKCILQTAIPKLYPMRVTDFACNWEKVERMRRELKKGRSAGRRQACILRSAE